MERVGTSIGELDAILGGGLPVGALVLLAGGPGTGKTILAQQICFANATAEHKAIYYTTLSEPFFKLVRHLEPFDFYDPRAPGERIEFVHLEGLLRENAPESGEGLAGLVTEVVRKAFESRPAIVVIDSVKALRDFVDESALRQAIYELASRVAHTGAILLLVGEFTIEEVEGSPESSLADGILFLAYEAHEPVDRRWLRVIKMRGANHLAGKHPFQIGPRGIDLFPRLEAIPVVYGQTVDGRIPTGIPGLDEMMSGGIPTSDATAVLGPSGSGKTVVALRFIVEGLWNGESCLFVSFQEDPAQLVRKAALFGWELGAAIQSGQLVIHHVPMGALNLDALAAAVRADLAHGSRRRVAIDSLAELVVAARESERFPAYARSLIGFIQAAGATVVVTSETPTLGPIAEPLGGLSFLFSNVVLLRYAEIGSRVGRAISIVKMRNSDHAKDAREFQIDSQGLTILDPLEDISGLLGWSVLRSAIHPHDPRR